MEKVILTIKQQRKINSLKNQVETLEEQMKEDLYSIFTQYMEYKNEVERLKKINKAIRKENRNLKIKLEEGNNKNGKAYKS